MHRRLAVGMAALVLGIAMAATPALSAKKKCKKLCKSQLTSCLQQCGSAGTKKDKRRCKKTCRVNYRKVVLPMCKAASYVPDACLPGSPSAAFLD